MKREKESIPPRIPEAFANLYSFRRSQQHGGKGGGEEKERTPCKPRNSWGKTSGLLGERQWTCLLPWGKVDVLMGRKNSEADLRDNPKAAHPRDFSR